MRTPLLIAAVLALAVAAPATAQDTTAVAEPAPTAATDADVVAVIGASTEHATLASALDASGLAVTLQGAGPFTVFAPTDAAFAAHGTMLADPAQAETLSGVLRYHVVPERLDAATLTERVREAGGSLTLTTVHGAPLAVQLNDLGQVVLMDAAGTMATVSAADLGASNGVVHSVDAVLMPSGPANGTHDGMDHDVHEEGGSN
ncbi:MAG TPA: fasciclin domain-containing protein [Rubricoccaceae bacterium]|jgi:uncharacterized surface protein with fasciclin (FAS1) repeats|nr:fasciclin domain-containing protein [Rubricoccaceae bacterium]